MCPRGRPRGLEAKDVLEDSTTSDKYVISCVKLFPFFDLFIVIKQVHVFIALSAKVIPTAITSCSIQTLQRAQSSANVALYTEVSCN